MSHTTRNVARVACVACVACIESMPREIIQNIFVFLDARALWNCASVNKLFREIVMTKYVTDQCFDFSRSPGLEGKIMRSHRTYIPDIGDRQAWETEILLADGEIMKNFKMPVWVQEHLKNIELTQNGLRIGRIKRSQLAMLRKIRNIDDEREIPFDSSSKGVVTKNAYHNVRIRIEFCDRACMVASNDWWIEYDVIRPEPPLTHMSDVSDVPAIPCQMYEIREISESKTYDIPRGAEWSYHSISETSSWITAIMIRAKTKDVCDIDGLSLSWASSQRYLFNISDFESYDGTYIVRFWDIWERITHHSVNLDTNFKIGIHTSANCDGKVEITILKCQLCLNGIPLKRI